MLSASLLCRALRKQERSLTCADAKHNKRTQLPSASSKHQSQTPDLGLGGWVGKSHLSLLLQCTNQVPDISSEGEGLSQKAVGDCADDSKEFCMPLVDRRLTHQNPQSVSKPALESSPLKTGTLSYFSRARSTASKAA